MKRALAIVAAGAFIVAACSSDGGGSVEAWCDSAQTFVDAGNPFEGGPDGFSDRAEEARDAISAIADDAPSEISDDAQTAADSAIEILDALDDIDPNDDEALNEALAPFEETDPEVEEATGNVNEYSITECGIDLNEAVG